MAHDVLTVHADDWPLERVLSLKGSHRIAIVIPARNEEATVADVVRVVTSELRGLADEIIVMDSLSTDGTAAVAEAAGASVHSVAAVRPDLGVHPGKGEALWKSLFVTDADILVFVDADLSEWGPHFVTGLVGPLLADPAVMLVRGFYDRVLDVEESPSLEGGRVTELVARPWLALNQPELASMVQPLAGEWAMRRSAFEQLSIPLGYGIELSTLLDVHNAHGLPAIVQVDLGRRAHRHQSLHDLSAMAVEILAVAERRRADLPHEVAGSSVLLRVPRSDRTWSERDVTVGERPAWVTVR